MNEKIKWVCIVIIIIATVAAAIAWGDDRPDTLTWCCRIGFSLVVVLAIIPILKLHFRADIAHDYLRERTTNYFNRDGFCFNFGLGVADGFAILTIYFQSQQEQRSIGHIALRPARGKLLTRAKFETITCKIDCAPAAFGVAMLTVPVPESLQGRSQVFEVGATVHYPDGKGRRLRFRDGIPLHTDCDFGNALGTTLTVAGAAAGALILSSPATVTLDLPVGVATGLPDDCRPEVRTVWRLGDVLLEGAI